MRDGLPFSKPRVRLHGDVGEAQTYLGEAYNLLFRVRQFCEASGAPVFSMSRALPDGAVVTAAIVGGEEIVSCTPPLSQRARVTPLRKRPVVDELINFYAVPTSMAHQSGYTPARQGVPYPGPSSVWENYPSDELPPKPAPLDPGNAGHPPLTPSYTLNQHPGALTWFSEQVREGGLPVVVSWRGPSCRYGRWGSLQYTEGGGNYLTTALVGSEVPSIYPGFSAFADEQHVFAADASWRSDKIWINGRPAVVVPQQAPTLPSGQSFSIWSAALKREQDPITQEYSTFLYVVCRDHLYKGAISKWRAHPGPDKEPRSIAVDLVGQFVDFPIEAWEQDFEIWQAPYINASCTKCVFLYDGFGSGGTQYSTTLAEGDFDTLNVTSVHRSQFWTYFDGLVETVGVNSTPIDENNALEEVTYSRTKGVQGEKTHVVIAADYKVDALIYIMEKRVDAYSPPETEVGRVSFLSTRTQSDEVSVSRTMSPGQSSVTFEHSVLGDIHSIEFTKGGSGTMHVAQDGGKEFWLTVENPPPATSSVTISWSGSYRNVVQRDVVGFQSDIVFLSYGFVVGGDLRFDAFALGVSHPSLAGYVIDGEFSSTGTPCSMLYYSDTTPARIEFFADPDRISLTDTMLFSPRVSYAVFVHGAKEFEVSGRLFPDVTEAIVNPSYGDPAFSYATARSGNYSEPAAEWATPIGTMSAGPSLPWIGAYTGLSQPHPAVVVAIYGDYDIDQKPGYACHFAFSPDGKYGYVGFRPPRLYDDTGSLLQAAHYESWILKDDEGVVTQVAIEESEFAPGEASTLAAPVFFGANVVKYEEDDPTA